MAFAWKLPLYFLLQEKKSLYSASTNVLSSLLSFYFQLNLELLWHCVYFILTISERNRAFSFKGATWKIVLASSHLLFMYIWPNNLRFSW